MEFQAYNFLAP